MLLIFLSYHLYIIKIVLTIMYWMIIIHFRIEDNDTPDVICHKIGLCLVEKGRQCNLYPLKHKVNMDDGHTNDVIKFIMCQSISIPV